MLPRIEPNEAAATSLVSAASSTHTDLLLVRRAYVVEFAPRIF